MNYTIRPLNTGHQYLDKGDYATFRNGHGTILDLPVFAFLIEGGGKKYLVDTGMADTERSVKYHHDGLQEPGRAIDALLAAQGIAPGDIDAILFTHLHWDHCSNLEKFPDAKLYASRIEYEFANDPLPFYWASYEYPPATGLTPPFAGRTFTLLDGETEVFEGIRMIPTPGHSPGHMAVSVQTENGVYYLVGDLMVLRDNMKPEPNKGWPIKPPGRFCNMIELWHSIELVMERAADTDHVLMTHDTYHLGVAQYP